MTFSIYKQTIAHQVAKGPRLGGPRIQVGGGGHFPAFHYPRGLHLSLDAPPLGMLVIGIAIRWTEDWEIIIRSALCL